MSDHAFPRDAAGRAHGPAPPGFRIVSLVPSITELLFDLGLGDHVVGRTGFCIHPGAAVAGVRRVGGTKTVKLDRVRALAPSHVVVNVDENTLEDVERIASFVPHVVVTHPTAPRDNLDLYRLLGAIFARQETAERLCLELEERLGEIEAAAPNLPVRRVLYLIWKDPWMTVSRDTYISRMLGLVNWLTAGDDGRHRYPELTLSRKRLDTVDTVLFSTEPYPFRQPHLEQFRAAFPGSRPALRLIDAEMVSWYGSRAIRGVGYLHSLALAGRPS